MPFPSPPRKKSQYTKRAAVQKSNYPTLNTEFENQQINTFSQLPLCYNVEIGITVFTRLNAPGVLF